MQGDMSGDDSSSSISDDSNNKRRKLSSSKEEQKEGVTGAISSPIHDGEGAIASNSGENRDENTSGKKSSLNWDLSGSNTGESVRGGMRIKGENPGLVHTNASSGGAIRIGNDDNNATEGMKPDSSTAVSASGSKVATRSEREERRMEANRQRARDIRKRKKKMVEEMKQQIVQLTLENRQLHRQSQLQQAEIQLLRRQANSALMGRQPQQPTPPHLLNHPMMGAQFLGASVSETNNNPQSSSARNNSMLTNPAALSGVLNQQNHPLGSNVSLLHPNRQHFLAENPSNPSLAGMSMMGHHGGAGGMNRQNNPSSVPGGMPGLPPSHLDSATGGSSMFPNRDLFFNQLLQQQQHQQQTFGASAAAGGLRMPRNLPEYQDFQEQDDSARGPGDSGSDKTRKR